VCWGLSMAVRGHRTGSRASILVAVVIGLAAAACGGGAAEERPSADDLPSSASTASTSPPTTTVEDAVREAYEAFVAMIDRLTTTTVDPDDPELARRAVDPALGALRTNLTTWRTEGQVWLAGDLTEHRIESVEIDGETAYVIDCTIANDALVGAGTTDVEFPSPMSVRDKATLVRQGNSWLVKYIDSLGQWDGVGCGA
jgi:hypothetical protein